MLLLASFVSSTRGLSVKFSPDFTKYYVEHDGVRRFSAEGGFAAFVNGKLESTSNGGWKTDATATSSGSDVTFGAYGKDETDATAADHSRDIAYEAVVLDALRPGYRCLPLRSKLGCRIDMCCLYLQVTITEAYPLAGEYGDSLAA